MKQFFSKHLGVFIAVFILLLWGGSLFLLLKADLSGNPVFIWFFVLLQTHLYTGVFITAHDAMHGTISTNKRVNTVIGYCCALLFAFNWYPLLYKKHHKHHKSPVSNDDPDYYDGSFWPWYFKFLKEYITWWQIFLMALVYNVLKIFFGEINVVLFWMMPAILSTFQLFYFGTYLPHKGSHDTGDKHKARSQRKNHFLAFVSCYFFGYHHEHHKYPYVPWWQLPRYR